MTLLQDNDAPMSLSLSLPPISIGPGFTNYLCGIRA